MATTAPTPGATPERIFQILGAYQQTAILKSAIELDIFSAIGGGASDSKEIAAKTGTTERGVRILCDSLTVMGLLGKTNGKYSLQEDAALFLDRKSPMCVATVIGFLGRSELQRSYASLAETIRKGTPPQDESAQPDNPFWVAFARSMAPLMAPAAAAIANVLSATSGTPMKVLDIAAGHGMFGITIARQNPKARIVAADWAPVLTVALENAHKFGVDGQMEVIPGSAFDVEFGRDFDVVLLTNFLHHFDTATNEKLLKKIHAALKPGGKAVTLEFMPNEDRVSPPDAAMFGATMLATTAAGEAYTFSELDTMFRNSGFGQTTAHPVQGMPQTVLVTVK